MRSKWTDLIVDGFQSVVSSFNPSNSKSESEREAAPSGQRDNHIHDCRPSKRNHAPPLSASHASRPTESRVQMPVSRSTRQSKSNSVKEFLNQHDNAECDPIVCDSDEEDSDSHNPSRIHSSQLPRYPHSHPRTVLTRTRSRDESKLMRTLSYDTTAREHLEPAEKRHRRRESDATSVPDPMKKRSSFLTGVHPVNTLDTPSTPNSRAVFLDAKKRRNQSLRPSASRPNDAQYANNHHVPNKKVKTSHPSKSGTTSASAINLDKSQSIDDSADELQLTPPTKAGTRKSGQSQKHQAPNTSNGSAVANQRVYSVEVPNRLSTSPENEDSFTKVSARQRKADKDDLLGSSSPDHAGVEEVTKPTIASLLKQPKQRLSLLSKIQKQDERRTRVETSVEHLPTRASPSPKTLYENLSGQELVGKAMSGNVEITNHPKHATRLPKNRNAPSTSLSLKEVVYPKLDNSNAYVVQVFPGVRQFSINLESRSLSKDPLLAPFSIDKIIQFLYDDECIVRIMFSRSTAGSEELYLIFTSTQSAAAFIKFVEEVSSSVKVRSKEKGWMAAAHAAAKNKLANSSVHFETPSSKHESHVPGQEPLQKSKPTEKRPRLVDQLDNPKVAPRTPTIISGSERGSGVQPDITVEIPQVQREPRPQRSAVQKKAENPEHDSLQHGSIYPQNGADVIKFLGLDESKVRLSATGALGPRWSRDLVYPKPGKRSATVPFEDLDRLDEDEFLNDNLISFFMQYLETFMEKNRPDLYKRTYFFNTYFFERLTKNMKGREINFDAVSRWTKAIDIFNRDFVVVPVNENLHWYLAIICNLPNLRSPPEERDENHLDQNPEIAVEVQGEPAMDPPQVRSDLVTEPEDYNMAPTAETQNSLAELTLSDHDLSVNGTPPSYLKKISNKRKQPRRSLHKYPLDKPVIITLDSLGTPRSATCSILKNYIVAEGKDKRNLDIDVSAIQGMTAKGIPTQSNYSDCGLYLCMYMEQFIADPNNFVARILQRQESAQLWPSKIRSEDLRTGLRNLILEAHRRQEGEIPVHEIPGVGGIMLGERDPQPTSEKDDRQITMQEVEQARQRLNEVVKDSQQPSLARALKSTRDQSPPTTDRPASRHRNKNYEMTANSDHKSPRSLPPPKNSPRIYRVNRMKGTNDDIVDDENPDSPRVVTRSATARPSHTSPAELVADLQHQDEEHEGRKLLRLNEAHKHKRSESVSTDYLSGTASWAALASAAAPSCGGKLVKMSKQRDEVAGEGKANSGPRSPQMNATTLSKNQPDRKRKRNPTRTSRETESRVSHVEVSETQPSEHSQSEGRHRTPPTSDGFKPRRGKATHSPRQKRTPNKGFEDSGIEKDPEDEDLDGEMLFK